MEKKMLKQENKFLQRQKKRKRWYRAVSILSCFVVFCTVYALILPAITMEKQTYCGEEHTHTLACYSNPDADVETAEQWESTLPTLTGNLSDDFLLVADSQIGYQESQLNYEVMDDDIIKGYTRYGDWYGEPYGDWSGMFVSFCLNYANISREIFPYDADCQSWADALSQCGMYEEAGDYAPKAGDIVFLNENAEDNEDIDHAGIVKNVSEDGNLTVVEGDCEDEVRCSTYALSDDSVKGYGILPTDESTEKAVESTAETDLGDEEQEEPSVIDTFADAGSISAGESVQIHIGNTVTLKGKSGKKHTWTANPAGCVTIQANHASAVITGTTSGTVTVTHTTQKGGSETFTIVVLSAEDAAQEISAKGSAYTVAVKGKKSVLSDGVTLHVEDFDKTEEDYPAYYQALTEDMEDATSGTISNDSFAFLKMYHIYLTKDGQEGEYVPDGNVNLQVTITYDTPPDGWSKVNWVGHYKKKNGTISKEPVSNGNSTSTGVKQIKVSGNSITFHIQSFSVFSVAALSTDSSGGSSGGGTAAKSDGSILTDDNLSWIGDAKSNEWQIVDGEYAGNKASDKITSEDEKVRVQKNVIPTGVENEFLVYLSVDTKQLFSDFFASAEYQATTSNNYHDQNLGTVVNAMTGNKSVQVSGKPQYDRSAKFTILSADAELLAEDVTLYWSQANNVTFYLKVKDGSIDKYVLIGVEVKKDSGNVVMLSEEAEKLIMSNVAQMAALNQVTDTMGDYVDFISVVSGDYSTAPSYNKETRTLTWIPAVKANPEIDKVRSDQSKTVTWTDHNGNVQTQTVYKYTSWALNTTELVYKVRLAVGREGFSSAASNLNSKVGEKESYQVNVSAVLSYGGGSEMSFPVPYVRGLLYDLQFEKVDKKDHTKKLSGAMFELTDTSGNTYTVTEDSKQTGLYRVVDLPWGSYTLIEKEPPSGYQLNTDDSNLWKADICYTTDRSMQSDSDRTQNMIFTGNNSQDQLWQIENEKIQLYVDLLKTDMTYAYLLDGAEFSVYDCDPLQQGAVPMTGLDNISTTNGVIVDNLAVENGKTYYIVETKAPEGYQLPDNPVVALTVNTDNTTASGQIAVTGGAGTAEVTPEKQIIDGLEVTVYQIKIPNNPGVALPKTGGTGTLPYTLSGLGIILMAFMYGYLKKRRQKTPTNDAA